MTSTELIEKIKSLSKKSEGYFAYKMDETEELGKAPIVDEKGDCEGGGDFSMVVRYFENFGIYIRETGYYSSYNGTDWNNDFEEVKPVQKTITVYE